MTFSQPFIINNHQLTVDINIGISIYPNHSEIDEELLHMADIAMYKAKGDQSHYVLYKAQKNS